MFGRVPVEWFKILSRLVNVTTSWGANKKRSHQSSEDLSVFFRPFSFTTNLQVVSNTAVVSFYIWE